MKDRPKETSEAHQISEKKPSLKRYREEADRLTEARQISGQTLQERVKRFKNGETTLSEADAKTVLDALAKGAKISLEGTISLVGDPRRWGGMSGEGPSTPYESSDDDDENESRKKQRYEHHDGAGSSHTAEDELNQDDWDTLNKQNKQLHNMYEFQDKQLRNLYETEDLERIKKIQREAEKLMIECHRLANVDNEKLQDAYEANLKSIGYESSNESDSESQ